MEISHSLNILSISVPSIGYSNYRPMANFHQPFVIIQIVKPIFKNIILLYRPTVINYYIDMRVYPIDQTNTVMVMIRLQLLSVKQATTLCNRKYTIKCKHRCGSKIIIRKFITRAMSEYISNIFSL